MQNICTFYYKIIMTPANLIRNTYFIITEIRKCLVKIIYLNLLIHVTTIKTRCSSHMDRSHEGHAILVFLSFCLLHNKHLTFLSNSMRCKPSNIDVCIFKMSTIAAFKSLWIVIFVYLSCKWALIKWRYNCSRQYVADILELLFSRIYLHFSRMWTFITAWSSMPKNTRIGHLFVFLAVEYEWHNLSKQSVPPFVAIIMWYYFWFTIYNICRVQICWCK